ETTPYTNPQIDTFGNNITRCIIPDPIEREDLLKHAQRFTNCFTNSNGSKKYCYKDQCINSNLLSNCKDQNCIDMDTFFVPTLNFQNISKYNNKSIFEESDLKRKAAVNNDAYSNDIMHAIIQKNISKLIYICCFSMIMLCFILFSALKFRNIKRRYFNIKTEC
ncbi:hypothetical protein HZS_6660, partial [Henneguya salminicola]